MNEPLCLLYSIVYPEDKHERMRRYRAVVDLGIEPKDFLDDDASALFDFLQKYAAEYRYPPTLSILEVETGFRFDGSFNADQFEYWLNKFQKFRKSTILLSYISTLSKILSTESFSLIQDAEAQFARTWSRLFKRRNVVPIVDAIENAIDEHDLLQQTIVDSGIRLGFPFVDAATGGIRGGDIALVIGASGSGKTYILCKAAEHAASLNKRILFVSMEMTSTQIGRRVGALGAHIDSTGLRLGMLSYFAMEQLKEYVSRLKQRDKDHFVLIEGSMSVSISDLRMYIQEFRPDALFIDGVYMLKPSGGVGSNKKRWEQLLEAVEELKVLAVDEKIAIIGSMQFKRKGAKEGLEGIGYSYAVAQAASLAFSIRDIETGEKFVDIDPDYRTQDFKILEIIKGREGESGSILIRYDMQRAFIEEAKIIDGENFCDTSEKFDLEDLTNEEFVL